MPVADDFRRKLREKLDQATKEGRRYLDVKSGELHRDVGGYPGQNHRMPVCCKVMRSAMNGADEIIAAPEKGDGASLVIRYTLPKM